MKYVDVTRAILEALAAVHPRGIHTEALAAIVSCEEAALRKELWLLKKMGVVRSNDSAAEVRVTQARDTDAATLRRGRPSSETERRQHRAFPPFLLHPSLQRVRRRAERCRPRRPQLEVSR